MSFMHAQSYMKPCAPQVWLKGNVKQVVIRGYYSEELVLTITRRLRKQKPVLADLIHIS